jgi:hypothetical protein
MKRKRDLTKSENSDLLFRNHKVSIFKSKDEWYFEIGKEMTKDLAEAVTILMKTTGVTDEIWNIEIKNINLDEISPSRSLYYLTGGYEEWITLPNYKKSWSECHLDFQEEFGFMIVKILEKSKKLSDVRDGFRKYLNLPILYEFALSKNFIR